MRAVSPTGAPPPPPPKPKPKPKGKHSIFSRVASAAKSVGGVAVKAQTKLAQWQISQLEKGAKVSIDRVSGGGA